ncbi:hypothetical protein FB451DRAFT_1179385 [Mycena latifolia]|nr:hypothetical protein FB451DRAFT_1179385 [Mycena latifolia]
MARRGIGQDRCHKHEVARWAGRQQIDRHLRGYAFTTSKGGEDCGLLEAYCVKGVLHEKVTELEYSPDLSNVNCKDGEGGTGMANRNMLLLFLSCQMGQQSLEGSANCLEAEIKKWQVGVGNWMVAQKKRVSEGGRESSSCLIPEEVLFCRPYTITGSRIKEVAAWGQKGRDSGLTERLKLEATIYRQAPELVVWCGLQNAVGQCQGNLKRGKEQIMRLDGEGMGAWQVKMDRGLGVLDNQTQKLVLQRVIVLLFTRHREGGVAFGAEIVYCAEEGAAMVYWGDKGAAVR